MTEPMTRLVLDADTGIDDALALSYLLASPQADLLGVVGTYGNVTAQSAVRNSRDVLRLFGRDDIPVFAGCEAPSWADLFEVDEGCARFHGSNGLGNVNPATYMPQGGDLDHAGDHTGDGDHAAGAARSAEAARSSAAFRGRLIKSVGGEHVDVVATDVAPTNASAATTAAFATTAASAAASAAGVAATTYAAMADAAAASREGEGVRFIIDTVRRLGRDVTVVATGPLTDIDAAIRQAPDIAANLKLVIMGGSLTQEGNCYDLVCETNIFQDPEAANRVFRSGVDVTMVGLDVTHQCLMTREDAESWRATGTRRGAFLADMVRFYINANESSDPIFLAGSPLHDPLAVAVALDPTLVDCLPINMMTETATGNGHGVRGRTIGDPTRLRQTNKTTHVAFGVDARRFTTMFRERLEALCR
ncbi:nucleoside hydrolase [Bifidobacterium jacchi]